MSERVFNVWLEIEELDVESDEAIDTHDAIKLGEFRTLEEAETFFDAAQTAAGG